MNPRCALLSQTTVIRRLRYFTLIKSQRGVAFAYMQRLTGYSRQHLSRLIAQYRDSKSLNLKKRTSRTTFTRTYGPEDVALLAETDSLHDTLSGPATKVLLILWQSSGPRENQLRNWTTLTGTLRRCYYRAPSIASRERSPIIAQLLLLPHPRLCASKQSNSNIATNF